MKYFKLFLLLTAFNLSVVVVSAQSNNAQSMTVTPSPYPDKTTKPAIVIANPQDRNATPQNEVHQESMTVQPESKLSIGKANVVPATRENPVQYSKEKNKVNYSEQKIERQEVPVNNQSINPK